MLSICKIREVRKKQKKDFGTLDKPGIDDYVSITGISSTTQFQSNEPIIRCIRVRSQSDITYIERYIPGRRVSSGLVDPNNAAISVGSKVRMVDDEVSSVYSGCVEIYEMGWAMHYCYVVNPAQTQLQSGDTVTVCGTYSAFPGLWGYPEILPSHIYLGGSEYGAMRLQSNMMSFSGGCDTSEGGGTFKPWPYPTAEEILASDSFKAQYNQEGSIGWALSQPDGTVLDMPVETAISEYYDGQVIGLKEWFEPLLNNTPKLFLYLEKPVVGLSDKMTAIDVVGATITTLSNGQRALVNPRAVYAYTDQNGQFMLPLPWPKHPQFTNNLRRANSLVESSSQDEWPWKLKITP